MLKSRPSTGSESSRSSTAYCSSGSKSSHSRSKHPSETASSSCLDGEPIERIGRYLDYNRARTAAAAADARIYIVVPHVKAVTAETSAGIEVSLGETIVWEPVPFEIRIAVLA